MKRVCVIGHFGFGHDLLNGQTIKTKIIANEIEKNVGKDEIVRIDTHGGLTAILKIPFLLLYAIIFFKNIIVMPAHNGLRIIVPLLVLYNLFFKRTLHYVVIGGWLPKFLEKNKSLIKYLKKIDFIYVETNTMRRALENNSFSNIVVMPNGKKLEILSENDVVASKSFPLALCTFSRVMKEKGIETIVDIIKRVNESIGKTVYKLDVYGQIDQGQQQWFEQLRKNFPHYIKYGGVVPFDQSVDVLKNYYALVFPTHFYTEGIPGSIIDAYAAGLPVISSKWESFSDVICEGKTGQGYEFDNLIELEQILRDCLDNPEKLDAFRLNCLKKAKEFTIGEVTKTLMQKLSS